MKKIYLTLIALVAAVMPSLAQTELWNNASQSLVSYYIAPGWNEDAASSASYDAATGVVTVHIENGLSQQWQGQVKLTTTGISYDPAKYYVFSCTFNSNNEVKSATVKLDDAVGVVYDNNITLTAGETNYTSKGYKGANGANNILVFDFGLAPGQTDITISNISIKEYAEDPNAPAEKVEPLDYNDANNEWKAVDEGEAFLSVTPWFADNNWSQIGDPTWKQNGSEWSLTLPDGMGGSQWQGQFPINTTLTAAKADKYDFCCVINSDQDLSGVTIKLTETDDADGTKHDGNFFFANRHDTENGELVYVEKGVTLSSNDAHALSLFFDFGGSPVGANITISNIVLINEANAAGIRSINADTTNDAIYNIAGQRVSNNYKGVVLQNGKKYLMK